MNGLDQCEALTGLVTAGVMTEGDAVAMLRERFDLTDVGARDMLRNWRQYRTEVQR